MWKVNKGGSEMTRQEAEKVAHDLRAVGWPVVSVAINDDGTWRAVAEDWSIRDGGWYRSNGGAHNDRQ
jgi:hypothetical protein